LSVAEPKYVLPAATAITARPVPLGVVDVEVGEAVELMVVVFDVVEEGAGVLDATVVEPYAKHILFSIWFYSWNSKVCTWRHWEYQGFEKVQVHPETQV
jgi:hypothetical protein